MEVREWSSGVAVCSHNTSGAGWVSRCRFPKEVSARMLWSPPTLEKDKWVILFPRPFLWGLPQGHEQRSMEMCIRSQSLVLYLHLMKLWSLQSFLIRCQIMFLLSSLTFKTSENVQLVHNDISTRQSFIVRGCPVHLRMFSGNSSLSLWHLDISKCFFPGLIIFLVRTTPSGSFTFPSYTSIIPLREY